MAITDLPTRTSDSIGATKTDRRPPTGATYEWKAAEVNETLDRIVELYDEVGLSDGSTVGSLNERVANLESGSGGALAEWNGTNLSQFATAVTTGFTNPVLAVATSGSSSYIRFTADAAAAGAYYIRYFSAPVPMQSMNGRAWVLPVTRTAGDELYGGLAFAGSGTSPPLVNTVVIGTDNTDTTGGAFGASNGANPATGVSWTSGAIGQLTFGINWSQVGSNVPAYAFTSSTVGIDATGIFAGLPGLAGFPAVNAAWASSTPTKVGIFIWGGNNGASNPVELLLWDIKFEAR